MKQKILNFVLYVLVIGISLSASAYDFKVGNLCYDIYSTTDSTVKVTFETGSTEYIASYRDLPSSIEIPQTVYYNGRTWKVVQIGDFAFRGCRELKEVTVLGGIQSIGANAFDSCVSLTTISLPSSLLLLNFYAFQNCSSLQQIDCYASCPPLCMGKEVFDLKLKYNHPTGYCQVYVHANSVQDYQHAVGWRDLPINSFQEETSQTLWFGKIVDSPNKVVLVKPNSGEYYGDIIIPEAFEYEGSYYEVYGIYDDAFANCEKLTSVVIPECIEVIGNQAFLNCKNLTSIKIPTNISLIGTSAFKGCDNLTTVDYFCKKGWSSGVGGETAIWANPPFAECVNLKNINLGGTVEQIPDDVFKGTPINDIIIPDNVTEICADAFAECYELKTITIGKNVTSMSNACFGNNGEKASKIETVYYNATRMTQYTGNQSKWYPFYNSPVKKLEIGENVVSLPTNAFNECAKLESITVLSNIPPACGTNTFTKVNKTTCILRVPLSALSAYKNSNVWKEFKNIVPINSESSGLVWSCDDMEVTNSSNVKLNINMKALNDIAAFQCDITLPEGIELFSNNGLIQVDKGAMCTNNHTISASKIDAHKYRLLCYSLTNTPLNLISDILFTLHLNCVEGKLGNNEIVISNIHLSDINSNDKTIYPLYVRLMLTEREYVKGDTNGNGSVTVADAVNTVNWTLGKDTEVFLEEVADVNADGLINISDVVGIINIALRSDIISGRLGSERRIANLNTGMSNQISLPDFQIASGEEKELEISLDNFDTFTAFQFDIKLPVGIELVQSNGNFDFALTSRAGSDHSISSYIHQNGDIRILCLSTTSVPFKGNSGALLKFKIKATQKVVNSEIKLHNIMFTTPSATEIVLEDVKTIVNASSGIKDDVWEDNLDNVQYFNLHGIEVPNPEGLVPGIYIKRVGGVTQKIMVK